MARGIWKNGPGGSIARQESARYKHDVVRRLHLRRDLGVVGAVLMASCVITPFEEEPLASEPCVSVPGRYSHEVVVRGTARRYVVAVGARVEADAPLVYGWHGFGSSAVQFARSIEPARQWPEAVFVFGQGAPRTFPQLTPQARDGWQIRKGELDDRDLAFFDALKQDVEQRYCVSPTRQFSFGFSNGGFFTNLLACERGEPLVAAASIGGGGPFESGGCRGAPAVMVVHGRHDAVVPFRFGDESAARWTEQRGCKPQNASAYGCTFWEGCDAPVSMCAFEGRHVWPVTERARVFEFFRGHRWAR